MTLTANPGFLGSQSITFSVSEGGFTTTDSIVVNVTAPPEIVNLPGVIEFPEDGEYQSPLYSQIVQDQDHGSNVITFSGSVQNGPLTLEFRESEGRFYLRAASNYNGNGRIRLIASDPLGAKDTLDVEVRVLPVNDPPVITPIGSRSIAPDRIDESLVLNNFVSDVDNTLSQLTWSFQGGQNITVTLLPSDNYRVRLQPATGFTGSEQLIFTVSDPEGMSDSDFVTVTVQKQAPRVSGLPDAVLCSTDSLIHNYVDLDNYVVDIDDSPETLTWTYSGDSAITTLYSPATNFVRFQLEELEQRGWEKRIFTAGDPDNSTGSDTIYVVAVKRGWPTLIDIPDVVLVAGGTDNSIVLDSYVFLCSELSKDQIIWSATGNTRVGVTINPTTRRVTLTAPADFFGSEVITFRSAAPGGGFDEDRITVSVVPAIGVPFLSAFENIVLTKDRPSTLIDLGSHLLIYPDSLRRYVAWTFGGGNAAIVVSVNQANESATLTLGNTAFLGEVAYTITARNTLNNEGDQANLTVKVTEGKGPILGKLPDVSFLAGVKDSSVKLDLYVRDEDTADKDIIWTVAGNTNITVNTDRLARNADHVLELGNQPGFIGSEILIVSARDPEGNVAQDTMIAAVRFTSEYEISVIPNAVVGEFIDVIVSASDSLREKPVVKIQTLDSEEFLSVNRIPGAFLWKTDYVFPAKFQGSAMIISTAINWFGKGLRDSSVFSMGNLVKSAPLVLDGGGATVRFASGSVEKEKKVVLIPEKRRSAVPGNRGETSPHLEFVRGFWLGPTEMQLLRPGTMRLALSEEELRLSGMKKAVLLHGTYDDDNPAFIGSLSSEGSLEGEFSSFGYYYLAIDETPPEISPGSPQVEGGNLIIRLEIADGGSGVGPDGVRVSWGGQAIAGTYDPASKILTVPLAQLGNVQTGAAVLDLVARDRAGNESRRHEILLEDGFLTVPVQYLLRQNYPNPFNPATSIEYVLPREERVRITIYSISGQEILKLVDGVKSAGSHQVQWDGRNSSGIPVSAGIYLYSLETANYRDIRKMTYLK